jgi:hypothetical protein
LGRLNIEKEGFTSEVEIEEAKMDSKMDSKTVEIWTRK